MTINTTTTRQSDRLTITDVADALDAAGYGIAYYCTAARLKLTESNEKARSVYPETVAYSIKLVEAHEGDTRVHHITLGALLDAWDVLTSPTQAHVNQTIAGYFHHAIADPDEVDMGCIDADAADVWVQVAAFGRIVYG